MIPVVGSNVAQYGAFYSTGYQANDDIVNNFVYKFGHNNNQALQILYQVRDLQDFGNLGGLAHQQFYPTIRRRTCRTALRRRRAREPSQVSRSRARSGSHS